MIRSSLALPWVAALVLQAILAGVLLAKKMWRKFPLFLSYAVTNLGLGLTAYVVFRSRSPFAYFITYWVKEGLGLLLGLAVVYEIFVHLFRPYPGLRKLATLVFQGVVVCLLILGCIVAYAQPVGERTPIVASVYIVEEATRILEVGLLLTLFLFASVFGLHWRQYAFGIALGLGIFVTVELVAVAMRFQFGITANPIFGIVRTVSFNLSLVIWMSYLLAPELATSPAEMPKRAQLEQWNNAIMELIYQ